MSTDQFIEQFTAMDSPDLVQRLVESFTALAAEVEVLQDRKTILEHKLRYAHEQVCLFVLSLVCTAHPPTYMMNIALDLYRSDD